MSPVSILTSFAIAASLLLGCASQGVSVKMPATPHQPAHEISAVRGRTEDYRPSVTVENVGGVDEEMFADLRRSFIEPLIQSHYRYVIDSIRVVAVPGVIREWTLYLTLDNGATVRVDEFAEWNESRQTYFYSSLKRALAGLDQASRRDPVLGRYVEQRGRKPQVSKAEQKVAQAEAQARAKERFAD